jgi:glycine/D-amino acid oxidase-like deaminating enzyme
VIVGAGYTGLWAARHALADEPARDVLVLDAGTAALGASGRNGGFLSASITHGAANGRAHFPDELATLHRLGNENYDALVGDLDALDIDAAFEPVGEIDVAVARWQADELPEHAALLRELGEDVELLDAEAVRAQVASPAFVGGVWTRSHVGLLPFPPEPLRWAAVQATRRALASADARDGRRGPWLRLLDRFGVGFDS